MLIGQQMTPFTSFSTRSSATLRKDSAWGKGQSWLGWEGERATAPGEKHPFILGPDGV